MPRKTQPPPEDREAWTQQTVANRRRCAVRGADPLLGEHGLLLQTGLEASDGEVAAPAA
jgi:hypothetical protein